MIDKLHKSATRYWQLVKRIPMGSGITRTPEFRSALDYRRQLDSEFGAANVRKAIQEAKS